MGNNLWYWSKQRDVVFCMFVKVGDGMYLVFVRVEQWHIFVKVEGCYVEFGVCQSRAVIHIWCLSNLRDYWVYIWCLSKQRHGVFSMFTLLFPPIPPLVPKDDGRITTATGSTSAATCDPRATSWHRVCQGNGRVQVKKLLCVGESWDEVCSCFSSYLFRWSVHFLIVFCL